MSFLMLDAYNEMIPAALHHFAARFLFSVEVYTTRNAVELYFVYGRENLISHLIRVCVRERECGKPL